ncbi:adhesion G protein-coupled receptor B1-like [Haliotis rubra]|uniref:adhesion G protein-coupled receptor B1-like n=1 Tax=Haliotis rubra TaxID=36100 RepID=UPI001EE5C599|nr:adhesion G protein-coupled receptor B1-like [Haliotis rubra]XP_046559271.1 adhesion G protein-coupled receptor B1-like [Haliotis rubra]XP_046559272.1 adhesion G protein-coupled receptor B1-like [Haliotis rubra]
MITIIYAACTCAVVLICLGLSEAGGERPNPKSDCKAFEVINVKVNVTPGELILKCSHRYPLTWNLEASSSSKYFRVTSKSGGLQVYLRASLHTYNKPNLTIIVNGVDGEGNMTSVQVEIHLEGPTEKEIKLITVPQTSLFKNGTNVVIRCEADQFVDPSFSWAVSGRDVTLGLTDRFLVNYTRQGTKSIGVFEFNPILHRDAGMFICILTGSADLRVRHERTLGLRVVSKPHVVARPPSVYIRGDTAVNLTCVQDDPPDTEVEMRWYRIIDGKRSRVSVSKGLVSREIYTVQGLGGDAEYVCEGFNIKGQAYSNVVKVHQLTEGMNTCPLETDQSGIIWQETPTGETSMSDCPSKLQGTSSRRCSLFGQWDNADYDTKCRQITLDNALQNAIQAKDGVLEGSLSDILNDLETAKDTELLTSNDIGVILEVLEIIAEGYIQGEGERSVEPDDIKKMATVVDTALSAGLEKWKQVNEETKRGPKSLLWSVDTILKLAIQRAATQESSELSFNITISTDNIYLHIGSVLGETVNFPQREVNSLSWVTETRTGARMMQESFQAMQQDRTWYSGMVYRSLSALMQEQVLENVTMEGKSLVSEDMAVMSETESQHPPMGDVVSRVMSFNVYPQPDSFTPPLYLSMEVSRMNSRPVCSFLDYSQSQRYSRSGVWATKGCYEMSRDDDVVVCSCNHTTNFAILMSPVDAEIGEHSYVLELISIVGCCISLFFLLLTIILYSMVWRYMVKTQVSRIKSILLMHLCATLIISYTLFLAGANYTDNKDVCTAVAALLHYFFLVVFCVMLAQGIQLFISIVIVINFTSYLKALLVTIWVPPAIIVGITLGTVKLDGYRGLKYCWLSTERHIIWAFVGPALFIIVVNTFILILSVRKMLTRKTWDENILSQGKYLARALGVILPIIGITWVLGVFSINRDVVVFQYLFAICNSLQGLFIFIFHCCTTNVTNSFKEMRSRFKRNSMSKSTLRSKSQTTINSLTSKSIKSYKSNYTLSLTTAALRSDRDGIDKQEFLSNGIANPRQGFQFARTIALPSVFDQSLETPTEYLIQGDARSDHGSGSPTSAQHVNMGFTDNVRRRPRVSFSVDYAEVIGFQEDFESSPDPGEGRRRTHQHNLSVEEIPESDIERALRMRRKPIDQMYNVVNAFHDRRTTVKEERGTPHTPRGRWRSAYEAVRQAKTFQITSTVYRGRDGTSQYL